MNGIIQEVDVFPGDDYFRFSAEVLARCQEEERLWPVAGSNPYGADGFGRDSYAFTFHPPDRAAGLPAPASRPRGRTIGGHPAPVGAKRSKTPGPGPAEVWGKETAGQALRMKIRNPMALTWIDRSKAPRGREATSDALAGRAARQNAQRNERIRSWRGDGVIRGWIRPDEDLRSAVMAQIKVARPLSPPAPDVPEPNRRMHS